MEEKYWILLNKYASGSLSPTERKELLGWIGNNPERDTLLNDFREIRSAGDYEEAPQTDMHAAWMKMQRRITPGPLPVVKEPGPKQTLIRIAVIVAVAVAVIIAFVMFNKP